MAAFPELEEAVLAGLADRGLSFVFPSEIVAEAWLERCLAASGRPAVEAGRFLGWDRFKELVSAESDGAKPATPFLRTVFAAGHLAENAKEPTLSVLIPREHAAGYAPFVGHVAARLPRLRGLAAAAVRRAGTAGGPPKGLLADWLEIHRAYEAFLAERGFFEPSYLPRRLRDPGRRFLLLFPGLIEDYADYAEALAASGFVAVMDPAPEGAPSPRLLEPATALGEIRAALREIGRRLDAGGDPADIVVTAADLAAYRPYLEREATLLSVPLDFRSGKPLAAYPGGRLFAAIGEAARTGFAFDAVRDLILSPAWPWKDEGLGRALVRAGATRCALAPWPAASGGALVDAWEASLGGSEGSPALLERYREIKRRVSAVAGAKSFAELKSAYFAFRGRLLADEGWNPLASLSLARAVEELGGLVRAEQEAGIEVAAPFGVFLRHLESVPYVPAGAAQGGGVRVFDWRVGAGLSPRLHLVLGASQEALAVAYRRFDFLREDERLALGGEEVDATPDFVAAYAASGDEVFFSCPREGLAGERPPHGILLSRAAPAGLPPPPPDAYEAERRWLAGEGPAPARLNGVQAKGLAAAGSARRRRREGAELSGGTAEAALCRILREEDGGILMSASSIDAYRRCPYAFLYGKILRAEPEAAGLDFADARFLGEVYHAALSRLFARIREEDGRFRAERRGDYASWLPAALDGAFALFSRETGPFAGVVLEAYRGRMLRYLGALVEEEAGRFPGLEVGPIEEDFELAYPGGLEGGPGRAVILRGRVDRLSLREGAAVIVDYKKGKLPDRGEVAPGEDGGVATAQIPAYIRLVGAAEGAAVDSAWYLSVEGSGDRLAPGAAVCAYGPAAAKPFVESESGGAFLAAFDAALLGAARGVEAGDYPFAPKAGQELSCAECGHRGLCRERYAARFE